MRESFPHRARLIEPSHRLYRTLALSEILPRLFHEVRQQWSRDKDLGDDFGGALLRFHSPVDHLMKIVPVAAELLKIGPITLPLSALIINGHILQTRAWAARARHIPDPANRSWRASCEA